MNGLSAIEFLERIANSFLLAILSWASYKKIVNSNQFVHALIVDFHFQLIDYAVLHFCMKQATVFQAFLNLLFFSLRFLKERD
jgi:hypothetical protein